MRDPSHLEQPDRRSATHLIDGLQKGGLADLLLLLAELHLEPSLFLLDVPSLLLQLHADAGQLGHVDQRLVVVHCERTTNGIRDYEINTK